MSDIATPAPKAAPKLQAGQAFISGRIDNKRAYQAQGKTQHETRIMLPAADQFSSPAAVAVVSNFPLGIVGEDVQLIVTIGGYRDSYKTREGDTVQTARNTLRAVEA